MGVCLWLASRHQHCPACSRCSIAPLPLSGQVRKYLRAQEVRQCKSLTAAINLVSTGLRTRGSDHLDDQLIAQDPLITKLRNKEQGNTTGSGHLDSRDSDTEVHRKQLHAASSISFLPAHARYPTPVCCCCGTDLSFFTQCPAGEGECGQQGRPRQQQRNRQRHLRGIQVRPRTLQR